MNALGIGGIVFLCAFGGALLGMLLSAHLPQHHLSTESRDLVRVAMTMVVTLAALVVGLLIASAKSSFDVKEAELRSGAAHAVLLDRTLAEYGPETKEARDLIRQIMVARIHQLWPEGVIDVRALQASTSGPSLEEVQRILLKLSPQTDGQRWLQSRALQITGDIAETRWLAAGQTGSSIQWPFLAILVFWVAVIFASFGLFAPRNGTVIAALLFSALSVAASIYLIVEMDQPYGGLIQISSDPLVNALAQLGRP